jgi:Spy/CpxP family protein refolding chaperone
MTLAASTALALSFAAGAVQAQPGGGMHGMHGGGGIEQMIPHMLERAKASLNLNTMQQGMWDSVVANGKAAREQGRTNLQQVRTALQTQAATNAPDLAAVAAVADQAQAQNAALRKGVRDQWLALYATFSPEQKAVVAGLLQKHLARAESMRTQMGERFRQHSNANTN